MARNGFKIFDADTHVRPDADLLERLFVGGERARSSRSTKSIKAKNKDGAVTYLMGERVIQAPAGLASDAAPQNKRIHERLQAPPAWQAQSSL